jgi:hypothetical protein
VNPLRDKEIIDIELQLKDLEAVDARIAKVQRAAKAGDSTAKKQFDYLERLKAALEQGKSARTELPENEEQIVLLRELQLLTAKPVLYLCNVDEGSVASGNAYVEQVREGVKDESAEVLVIGAAIEADIASLDTYEERQMFLQDIGLEEPGVSKLIKAAYRLLNLKTYFTAGVKEVRAWTIYEGYTAPQAAGVIHTDFEKGFIRAEVIKLADFLSFKSEAAVKEAGKMSVEGKEYVVQDGDIMHFRFNV